MPVNATSRHWQGFFLVVLLLVVVCSCNNAVELLESPFKLINHIELKMFRIQHNGSGAPSAVVLSVGEGLAGPVGAWGAQSSSQRGGPWGMDWRRRGAAWGIETVWVPVLHWQVL